MSVLDIQRKSQQIGRIRLGQKVRTESGKMRPGKLDTFRFTTASKSTADAIAALFGGTVRDWEGQFEVITERSEIGVTVPPRDAVISQFYEMWNKGGAIRRCDSQFDQISKGPCQCPHAADPSDAEAVDAAARKRAELSKTNPPQACKLVTRINVMIPDLPGLGVFRLDTGSFYAAGESGDKADLMEMARAKNVFLPAMLRIEQRKRVAGGKTTTYPVPVLEILSTFRSIANGELEAGGMAAQLPPAPNAPRLALAAGGTPATPQAPAAAPEGFAAVLASIKAAEPAVAGQRIANAAMVDRTANEMRSLIALAKELRVADDAVCTDEDHDAYETLSVFLTARWTELGRAAKSAEAGAA